MSVAAWEAPGRNWKPQGQLWINRDIGMRVLPRRTRKQRRIKKIAMMMEKIWKNDDHHVDDEWHLLELNLLRCDISQDDATQGAWSEKCSMTQNITLLWPLRVASLFYTDLMQELFRHVTVDCVPKILFERNLDTNLSISMDRPWTCCPLDAIKTRYRT